MTEAERIEHEAWPVRALLLLVLGALFGLAVHFLTRSSQPWTWTDDPVRIAAAAALVAGGIVLAFSLERLRWRWSVAFALGAGLVVGFVTYWNGRYPAWGSGEGWRFAAALVAVAIAVPLFQSARDSGGRRLDTEAVHDHAWTNAILWCLACAFTLAVFLLLHLLGALFDLIGLHFLERLLDHSWFFSMLGGGAFGAAVGMLRDRDAVLGLVQRVGRTILSVLAPLLGAGLLLFVLALPFTGLGPLWRETVETTPILLGCVISAVILANAVIGNAPDEEAKARLLRYAAMTLAVVILPLAIVAAISTGLRIGQYGFTPDRLWGVVAVGVALAGSAAYVAALALGRRAWPSRLRLHNVALAIGICLLALFLALPIVSFGAISTRDQLARLESGKVTPEKFDWVALRFDFGPSGKAAVERMARGSEPRLAGLARRVLALNGRWDAWEFDETLRRDAMSPAPLVVRPAGVAAPADLRALLYRRAEPGSEAICDGPGDCLLFRKPGDRQAIVLADGCAARVVGKEAQVRPGAKCRIEPTILELDEAGRWIVTSSTRPGVEDAQDRRQTFAPERPVSPAEERAMLERQRAAIERGDVEVREEVRVIRERQLFIGGKAEGDPFD